MEGPDLIIRCKHLEISWMNVDLLILVLWDQSSLGNKHFDK